jgi:anti-anti-sigma factor
VNIPFRVVRRDAAHAVIYDMIGDLSGHAEEAMLGMRDWSKGLDDGKRSLILNFTDVPYINSIGISVLIRIVRTLLDAGCSSFAYGITPHYQKLFRMIGLTEHMMIYPNEFAILERIKQLEA